MKVVNRLAATTLAILLAGGLGFAQAGPGGRGAGRPQRGGAEQDRAPGASVMMRVEYMCRAYGLLDLTQEQKDNLGKMRTEFNAKAQPLMEKMQTTSKTLAERQQNDPEDAEGIKQMKQEIGENSRALELALAEFTEKSQGLLTDEQRAKMEQGPGQRGGQGQARQFIQNMRFSMQSLMPFDLRAVGALNLTDAQQKQSVDLLTQWRVEAAKLAAQYQEKFKGILTEEQKKQYDEIQANQPQAENVGQGQRRQGRQGGDNAPPPAPPAAAPAPDAAK